MELSQKILGDLRRELSSEFDRNFERKGFFSKPWKVNKLINNRGSMMMRSGALRKGNQSKIIGNEIHFTNSRPYAKIQNEGGIIVVTQKMKKYFWAKYYESVGTLQVKFVKNKNVAERSTAMALSKTNIRISQEAAQWKALALMQVGKKLKITQRQFIGWDNSLNPKIEKVIEKHVTTYIQDFASKHFKKR